MLELPIDSVLVPVDFSDAAWAAVANAAALVKDTTRLHIVHVLPPNLVGPDAPFLDVADQGDLLGNARQMLVERLTESGLAGAHVHVSFAPGNPAATIADTALALGVDLVLIPSHGRTGLLRLALGSVAERVVRLAPCPVLVIKGGTPPQTQLEKNR